MSMSDLPLAITGVGLIMLSAVTAAMMYAPIPISAKVHIFCLNLALIATYWLIGVADETITRLKQ